MKLSDKTLEKLTALINEEPEHRSLSALVRFFNDLGFREVYRYGSGAPSRSAYTFDHLKVLNAKGEVETAIKKFFEPQQFRGHDEKFIQSVKELNGELIYDGWQVFWDEGLNSISFRRGQKKFCFTAASSKIAQPKEETEAEFLKKEFAEIQLDGLLTNMPGIQEVVEVRLAELKKCLAHETPLSAIFLTGSVLEAVLLSVAMKHVREFVAAKAAPKGRDDKTLQPQEWKLHALIDVAKELGYVGEDVYKFCHVVRDFRNYIHPFEQWSRKFTPEKHTAQICFHVLKGAIYQVRIKEFGRV